MNDTEFHFAAREADKIELRLRRLGTWDEEWTEAKLVKKFYWLNGLSGKKVTRHHLTIRLVLARMSEPYVEA